MLGLMLLCGSQSVLAEVPLVTADEGLLMKYCSQCHAPPNPAKHQPRFWKPVVHRMQNHRIMRGFGKIPDQEAARLVGYLEMNAKEK